MIDLKELEKDYAVFYTPVEGYKYLYIGRKNDPNEILRIFPSMSLKESLKVAKENNTQIRYVIPLDKDDELELKVVCEELNQSKF